MLNRIDLIGTNKKNDRYLIWEVHVDGHMVSSFFGGSSFMAAAAFVEFLKSGKTMRDANDVVAEMTRNETSLSIYAPNVMGVAR